MKSMKVQYLEIVTLDIDAICAAYAAGFDAVFGDPVEALGGARTATLADGSMVGVRAPMHPSEAPVVRPYWLVEDVEAAVAAVTAAGGELALAPTELAGLGTFAIYQQGGNDHGLWQLPTSD